MVPAIYPNEQTTPQAVLISVDTGEFDVEQSLDELEELSRTAGAQVLARVVQKRESPDSATCIGSGRLEEVRDFCEANGGDLLIFDVELSATQTRNIEEITGVQAVDRTTLILDIFAIRARSKEGRLQVELAQQRYRLPRLAGMGVKLSRLGAGIGTRGPGETKLETDRRHIRRRIQTLERELEQMEKRREMMHRRRKKDGITTVAIVGYTNVGKSTLLNALTDAGVLAEDKLFATLDPTARSLTLPDGRSVLLVDTVGLIRRLPHHLVEAFKSTLEEAAQADLILHICDISSDEAGEQAEVTERLLGELGCGDIPLLRVYNKCDKLTLAPEELSGGDGVFISAKTGFGFDELLRRISKMLTTSSRRMTLLIPYDQGGFAAKVRENGKVFSEEYVEDGIRLDALVESRLLRQAAEYEYKEA